MVYSRGAEDPYEAWASLEAGFKRASAGYGPAQGSAQRCVVPKGSGAFVCLLCRAWGSRSEVGAHTRQRRPLAALLSSLCRASTSLLGKAAILQAEEKAGSLSADGIQVERPNALVSSVMKGDGQVITKPAVINHQLRGFIQSLDTPEDTLRAGDMATGVSCNMRLSNQSLSNRQNELTVRVCVSQTEDAIKKEIQLGTRPHLLPLARLDAFLTSSSNTQPPL